MKSSSKHQGLTRRDILKGGAAALASAVLPMSSWAAAGSVTITDGGGAWGAAQRKAYFEPFEKETGIRVDLVPYALPGKLKASVLAGSPVADVVDLTGAKLPEFSRSNLLLPIDFKAFDPQDLAALKPVPAHPYGVPSLFGSIVLAYADSVAKSRAPATWKDFWDSKLFVGQRTLADGGAFPGGGTFEIALMADGVTHDKIYPIDWKRAFKSLDRIKPDMARFWSGMAEPVQMLVDGNATIASAYNGRVSDMQAKGAKIAFSWRDGILSWDHWVVPKGSANAANAMKFIAFATRADRQAEFATLINYGPTNSRAFAHMTPERISQMPSAPAVRDLQLATNYEWWAAEASPGVSNETLATQLWEKWLQS
ncbi:ABC transporter substrate-binding protein [Paraburkholderia phytofirmans]|uniref:ABC transporter substrate-binding protein n=1 Tax=Paraburkholderia phytofirmans TaxID=261302 RepID=UPI0009ED5A3C|nr:ABC transporter substrate-binding protein [Paraburkholderia phytofirmans]